MPQQTQFLTPQRNVRVSTPTAVLEGHLAVPVRARGFVILADGSSERCYRGANDEAAQQLRKAGFATLNLSLLGPAELVEDAETSTLRFDLQLLADRLLGAVSWAKHHPSLSRLPVGLVAGGTCAAAALVAAAHDMDGRIASIVSRGGRPELAGSSLTRVKAPTLLLVGEFDTANLATNQRALGSLPSGSRLQVLQGQRHSLEDGDALRRATELSAAWFELGFTPAPRELLQLHVAV
jgi:putative phosphoribosyl transferase